jgi:anti-anti-sigma factor
VDAFCARHAVPQRLVHETQIVLDEVLSNVIRHAFTDTAEHRICVTLDLSGDELLAAIEDDGIPFDPTLTGVKLSAGRANTGEGGLGLAFIRALCGRISYRREAGRNHLCVAWRIGREGLGDRTSPQRPPDAPHEDASGMSTGRHSDAANAKTTKAQVDGPIAGGGRHVAVALNPIIHKGDSVDIIATQLQEFSAVEVRGRIDSTTAGSLQERLCALARSGHKGLIVDLGQVPYMSSAGFRALLVAAKAGEDSGCDLALHGLNGEVRRLFTIGGFDELFLVLASREDCVARLRSKSA